MVEGSEVAACWKELPCRRNLPSPERDNEMEELNSILLIKGKNNKLPEVLLRKMDIIVGKIEKIHVRNNPRKSKHDNSSSFDS